MVAPLRSPFSGIAHTRWKTCPLMRFSDQGSWSSCVKLQPLGHVRFVFQMILKSDVLTPLPFPVFLQSVFGHRPPVESVDQWSWSLEMVQDTGRPAHLCHKETPEWKTLGNTLVHTVFRHCWMYCLRPLNVICVLF